MNQEKIDNSKKGASCPPMKKKQTRQISEEKKRTKRKGTGMSRKVVETCPIFLRSKFLMLLFSLQINLITSQH